MNNDTTYTTCPFYTQQDSPTGVYVYFHKTDEESGEYINPEGEFYSLIIDEKSGKFFEKIDDAVEENDLIKYK